MATLDFQIRKANGVQPYYWRIVSTGNSSVLATSETYYNKQDAINAADIVRKNSASSDFTDYTGE